MEFVGTDTVPFRGLLELINMHKQELLKIVDVETLYSLDILQGKPCVIDGNFEFLSFNLNTAQSRRSYVISSSSIFLGIVLFSRPGPPTFVVQGYQLIPSSSSLLLFLTVGSRQGR